MRHARPAAVFTTCLVAVLLASCAKEEIRETVLDRIINIEEELNLEIPDVPRWCDQLEGLTKHRINVGDCELYVEEEGRGTPLVLINGGPGGTHHYFHPWFSRVKKYARVIYYDQRGCGLSDFEPGEVGYSVEQAVRDLDAIRTALGIEKWVLLGYSYGGFLAQYYTTIHPENSAGLILMGASPGMWVDMESGRQYDYISDEERARMSEIRTQLRQIREERGWSIQEYLSYSIYNNNLNGDWKRQQFYRPSRERIAQIALYEWVNDDNFNGIMSGSHQRVDLTGAFRENPIPTLILEGRNDLTWNTDKPGIIKGNHPNAEMIFFETASHPIYEEEPDKFFKELKRFIKGLPEVADEDVSAYREDLVDWDREKKASPQYVLRSAGWGMSGSEIIAGAYTADWLELFDSPNNYLRIGFALYDLRRYEEALSSFRKMEELAETQGDNEYGMMSNIWQGHMLDLLGRRSEAVALYRHVVEMNPDVGVWQHSQYAMAYEMVPWATERIRTPFKRIENQDRD